jgi:hypothetical protein
MNPPFLICSMVRRSLGYEAVIAEDVEFEELVPLRRASSAASVDD